MSLPLRVAGLFCRYRVRSSVILEESLLLLASGGGSCICLGRSLEEIIYLSARLPPLQPNPRISGRKWMGGWMGSDFWWTVHRTWGRGGSPVILSARTAEVGEGCEYVSFHPHAHAVRKQHVTNAKMQQKLHGVPLKSDFTVRLSTIYQSSLCGRMHWKPYID